LNGFVGEFLVLLGTFSTNWLRATLAASGVVLSAVYMLWMYQRVIWGEIRNVENQTLLDIGPRERWMIIPLLILIVWMGMYSDHFLRPMDASIMKIISQLRSSDLEYAVDFELPFLDSGNGVAGGQPLPNRTSAIGDPASQ
jgi:NADH-quinone oxidoreductase subunit M